MAVPEDQRLIRARFGGAKQRIGEPIEFRIRTRSNKLIWVRTLSKPILENKMFRGARGILSDISRRKTAEEKLIRYQEKLRSLASRMTMVEEAERLRIASFLHDNIAQKMALAKIKLEQIPASNIQGGDLKTLNEAFNFVDDSIRDLRSLTFDLSPPILYKLGLGPALEWLAEETRKKYGLAVEFQRVEGPGKIDGRLSSILFQCARELLMNIVKHARAKRAMISFRKSRKKVYIQVEDDGMGFDIDLLRSSSLQSSGFGLFSIQERLAEFQGRMIIKSETGAGTRALLSAPLGRKSNSSSFK
jgi:signal transduction histidine kinase